MYDKKGNLYILDVILALIIILLATLAINTLISIPNPTVPEKNYNTAQDTMEMLSGKVNFTEKTFIAEISQILKNNKNSKQSIEEVSNLASEKLKEFNLHHYCFKENNKLDGKVLASSGNVEKAENVSVATRIHGDYSYTLYVW